MGGVSDVNSSKEVLGEEVIRDYSLLLIKHLDPLANCIVRDAALRQPRGGGDAARHARYT